MKMQDFDPVTPAENLEMIGIEVVREFNLLRALINGNLSLSWKGGKETSFDVMQIQSVLAKSILFKAIRALRIIEHAKDKIPVSRDFRKSILKELSPFRAVRDISEHWQDVKGKKSEPRGHIHLDQAIEVDETSLVILGDDQVLMGPVNLFKLDETFQNLLKELGHPQPPNAF